MPKSVARTVKSKMSGSLKKLAKSADWLGAAAGYFGTITTAAQSWGGTSETMLSDLTTFHVNIVTKHNFGELQNLPAVMGAPEWNKWLMTGIAAAIIGKVGSYMPAVVPYQKPLTSIVGKAGFGMAAGSLLAMVLSRLAYGSSPFSKTGGGSRGSQPPATTSGRIPMAIKYSTNYPRDGGSRTAWTRPK